MPIDAGHELTTATHESISDERAAELAVALFGVRGRARRLDGEYDDNFHVAAGGREWLFKIAHPAESEAMIEAQDLAIQKVREGPKPRIGTTEIGGVRRFAR
ncbi:MAG TPA: hypothetical protein VIV65_03315, partial [Gemmatimonadaceae bacterium]